MIEFKVLFESHVTKYPGRTLGASAVSIQSRGLTISMASLIASPEFIISYCNDYTMIIEEELLSKLNLCLFVDRTANVIRATLVQGS